MEEKRNVGGRPPHSPTADGRAHVERMSGLGIPEEQIATVIGISAMTLRKHYRAELDKGQVDANVQVAQSLFNKAIGNGTGAVAACIFWLKVRARWSEAMPTRPNDPLEGIDPDELARLREELDAERDRRLAANAEPEGAGKLH